MKLLIKYLFLLLVVGMTIPDSMVLAQDSLAASQPDSTASISINTNIVQLKDFFSVTKIISIIIVLAVAYFLNRLMLFLMGALAEKSSSYRLLLKRVVPFINVGIWSVALFIVIAGIISPPIETILTVGASIGIAVGFAAQDILKNIFGGFIIILDRPFQVGDKIMVDDYYGEVIEIGLRSTRIVTPDDSVISLPNADIVSNAVSNANSGALDCQVVSSIFLPVNADLDLVKEIGYKAAATSRYVYLKKPIVVIAENKMIGQRNVVELKVKAYVLDIRYEFLLKSEVTELVLSELGRKNITAEASI